MTQTDALLVLNMLPRLGPVGVRRLLERFGNPQSTLRARRSELAQVQGLSAGALDSLLNWEKETDLTAELRRVQEAGVRITTILDADYPPSLKEIHDPPTVLYVWGALDPRDFHAVAVVGSRRTSHYGLECAKRFSYQLAYAGLTVVSGLARGIDAAAHQGALAAKGRTVAVLGGGLSHVYPPENFTLAERITSSGAVVTEFPMDAKPDRQTFPMRNRIISGWGFGVLVVEAGLNSGALITAHQAAEQGRSLYAVPGPIDRPTSRGTNRLIQDGAKLVIDARDILEDLQTLFPNPPALRPSSPPDLPAELSAVYHAIGSEGTAIDQIIVRSGLSAGEATAALLQLEVRNLVRQLPGNHFVKLL
ncbi:MAG: DNA-protecting protein DprA [Verrucomicrobia bacterium]|nr:DNA-protecting protein DprA [Verrucomicrobiota bacterium]